MEPRLVLLVVCWIVKMFYKMNGYQISDMKLNWINVELNCVLRMINYSTSLLLWIMIFTVLSLNACWYATFILLCLFVFMLHPNYFGLPRVLFDTQRIWSAVDYRTQGRATGLNEPYFEITSTISLRTLIFCKLNDVLLLLYIFILMIRFMF